MLYPSEVPKATNGDDLMNGVCNAHQINNLIYARRDNHTTVNLDRRVHAAFAGNTGGFDSVSDSVL